MGFVLCGTGRNVLESRGSDIVGPGAQTRNGVVHESALACILFIFLLISPLSRFLLAKPSSSTFMDGACNVGKCWVCEYGHPS